jgi:hypothetical protein
MALRLRLGFALVVAIDFARLVARLHNTAITIGILAGPVLTSALLLLLRALAMTALLRLSTALLALLLLVFTHGRHLLVLRTTPDSTQFIAVMFQ